MNISLIPVDSQYPNLALMKISAWHKAQGDTVEWYKRIRFGCDTPAQIAECERAISLLDKYGYRGEYFLYCILMDFEESFRRITRWRTNKRVVVRVKSSRNGKRTWLIGLTVRSCTARAISRTLVRAKVSFAGNTLHKNNL